MYTGIESQSYVAHITRTQKRLELKVTRSNDRLDRSPVVT